ncbi:hypothetical protein BDV06DRAFT_122428 [Aspergillus oleicola]
MHSIATLGQGTSLFPRIRKIGFEEDRNQFTVAYLLVLGWTVQRPNQGCTDPPSGDFTTWMDELNSLSGEQRENLPPSEDTTTVHTPWRDQIYYMWNHVFYDVGNWLAGGFGTGTFRPPNTEVFGIGFPLTSNNEASEKEVRALAVTKVWDADTLLVPAYLAPGVSLRVEAVELGSEGADAEPFHPGNFDHKSRYNVWYVEKRIQLWFYVEGEWDHGKDGLAAVMVYGTMLGEPLQASDEDSEEDDKATGEDED